MRIAITGAAGWVGRAVVERALAGGHEVVGIDRTTHPEVPDLVVVDMADYDAVLATIGGCDAVVHLAAISGPGRHPDHVVHDTNVVASYHALRAAAEAGIARVCLASSINAIGGRFSIRPRYDSFPVDERHPAYPEDPYSLSKWIAEQQADAITRRYGTTIASLRLHGVVERREDARAWLDIPGDVVPKHLWGYVRRDATARACLLSLTADFEGHEVFYVVAPDTMVDEPSRDLAARWYPDVPITHDLDGTAGFFDISKTEAVLGWKHDVEAPA